MIELFKYFRILFLSKNLSREKLKDFTEAHILALTANNPGGIFTAILTAITNAYNSYYGDYSSELVNQAVQENKTIAMNESRVALEKNLSDNEKLIAYTYRNDAAVYEEFYPLGLTEYQNADLGTFDSITERYKTVLTNHAADFPPAFVTDYNTLRATFKSNRDAQLTAMFNVATERSDLQTTRPELAKQLTTNLLTIALQYVGDESKADVYFNQAILNEAFRESETKIEVTLDPGATALLFDNITKPEVELKGINNNSGPLYLGFKTAPNVPATADDKVLEANSQGTGTAAEAGWSSTHKYLVVTNPNPVTAVFYIEKT